MPLLRPQTPGLREQTESRPLEPPPPQRRESPPEMAPRGLGALSSQIWACGEAAAPGGLPGRPRRPSSASRRRSLSAPQAGPEASCPGAEWPAPAGLLSCSPPEYGEASPETSPPFVSHVSTPSPRSRAGTAAVLGVEALASESLAKPGVASSLSLSLGREPRGLDLGGGAAAIHALRAGRGSAAERSRSSTPASELPSDVELNAGGSPVCGSPGGGPSEAPSRGLDGLARLLSVRFGEGGSSSLRGRAPSADDGEASSPSSARLRGANSCPAAPGAKAAAAVSGALERIRTLAKSTSARVEAPQGMIAIAARPARPPPPTRRTRAAAEADLAPARARRRRAAHRPPGPGPGGRAGGGRRGADWAAPAAGAPAGALRAVHEAAVDGDDEGARTRRTAAAGRPRSRHRPAAPSPAPAATGPAPAAAPARSARRSSSRAPRRPRSARAAAPAAKETPRRRRRAGPGPARGGGGRSRCRRAPGSSSWARPGAGRRAGRAPWPDVARARGLPARRGPAAPLDLRTLAASLAAAAALPPVLRRGAPADSVEVEDL
eukprot:tig00021038_g17578.t1